MPVAGRGLGWKKDPPKQPGQTPDRLAAPRLRALPPPPPESSCRHLILDILDQGNLGSCHDAVTEVLTSRGWELFADLTGDELLATVDPVTADLTYERPVRLVRLPFVGDLVVGKTGSIDFRVTPDHKMLVRKWDQGAQTLADSYELVEANKLGWYSGLMNRVSWSGMGQDAYVLPAIPDHRHKPQREPRTIAMQVWMQFLGLYLAEGTVIRLPGHYRVQIAAFKERERTFTRGVLAEMGMRATEYDDRFVINNRQLHQELTRLELAGVYAPDKFVPEHVFEQSAENIRHFLRGHFEGYGSENKGARAHYTSSPQLADDLQRLIFLSGDESRISSREPRTSVMSDGREVIGRHPEYRVSVCAKKNLSIERGHAICREPYSGEVFCAEVSTHHTLVTRRNGKILISGNCVANAGMQALRASQFRQGATNPPLGSRLWGYYMARAYDKDTDNDNGTFIRNFFQAMVKFGYPPEELWPYSDDTGPGAPFMTKPPYSVASAAHDQSSNQSVPRYERINSDGADRILDIKRAIAEGFTVCFGTLVSQRFAGGDLGRGPILPPRGESIAGGHAMLIAGFDPDGFDVVNSWGTSFGEDGWCRFADDYISWDDSSDFWIVDTSPLFSDVD